MASNTKILIGIILLALVTTAATAASGTDTPTGNGTDTQTGNGTGNQTGNGTTGSKAQDGGGPPTVALVLGIAAVVLLAGAWAAVISRRRLRPGYVEAPEWAGINPPPVAAERPGDSK